MTPDVKWKRNANLKYKEVREPRREAPRRNIIESKHTEAAPTEGLEGGGIDNFQLRGRCLWWLFLKNWIKMNSYYYIGLFRFCKRLIPFLKTGKSETLHYYLKEYMFNLNESKI